MSLGPRARTLVGDSRKALQPSDADRERITAALRARLGDAAMTGDVGSAAASSGASQAVWPWLAAIAAGVTGAALFFAVPRERTECGATPSRAFGGEHPARAGSGPDCCSPAERDRTGTGALSSDSGRAAAVVGAAGIG